MPLPKTLSDRISSFCLDNEISDQKATVAHAAAENIYLDILTFRSKMDSITSWRFPAELIAFDLTTAIVFAGESDSTLQEIADLESTLDREAVYSVAGIPEFVLECVLIYQERLANLVLVKHRNNGSISEEELQTILHPAPYPNFET